MMPGIDVVIPVRNRSTYIVACLDSVRAQTVQPSMVVVVDDGSTDDTPEILADYARAWDRLCIIRTPRGGVSRARNVGIAACASPLIAFLDSDDLWAPEKLERQLALFERDSSLGFVHCGCEEIDASGQSLPGARPLIPSKRGQIFLSMIRDFYHILGSCSAVVARRELLKTVGGFDETLGYAEDQDLWFRLAIGNSVDFDPTILVKLRRHPGNSSYRAEENEPVKVLLDKLRVWNRWIEHFHGEAHTIGKLRELVAATRRSRGKKAPGSLALYAALTASKMEIVPLLFPSYAAFHKATRRRWFR